MIKAWFNERGYKVVTKKGESVFMYDLPTHVTDDATSLYTARWMVFNEMMEAIQNLHLEETEDLTLNTDSRLIEELRDNLEPTNAFAISSRRYFIQNDYVNFKRIYYEKCAPNTINNKLNEPIDVQ